MKKLIPSLVTIIAYCSLLCVLSATVFAVESSKIPPLDQWARQPVIVVPPVDGKPPVINGHDRPEEWKNAAEVTAFYAPYTGGLGKYPVRIRLCYDKDALYVAMKINRLPMSPMPKSTFDAGLHDSLWWIDDNVELVMEPGELGKSTPYGYAFVGNSVGGYGDLRYQQHGSSDKSWNGKWIYKAVKGDDYWKMELKIPFDQFEGAAPPHPGTEWLFDALVETVTPQRSLLDWSHMLSFDNNSYHSSTKARLIFGDHNSPIFRGGVGLLKPTKEKKMGKVPIGMRTILSNQGDESYRLEAQGVLYRADARQKDDLNFMDLWDRILFTRSTGKSVKINQESRDEASFLKELNRRYKLVKSESQHITVAPGKARSFSLEEPKKMGDYVVAYRFLDTKTGKLLRSEVKPFTVIPAFDVSLTPYFLQHQKLRVDVQMDDIPKETAAIVAKLEINKKNIASKKVLLQSGTHELHFYMDTSNWPQQTEGVVEANLIDVNGKVLESDHKTLLRPKNPSWWNQHLGMSQVVPLPFTAVQSPSPKEADVWERRYKFGDDGMPISITTRNDELLAGPITLNAGINNMPFVGKSTFARKSQTARDAVFESIRQNDALKITTRTTVHYDGAMRFDLVLQPNAKNVTVDKLVLEIPVKKKWAKLFTHRGIYTSFLKQQKKHLGGAVDSWFKIYPDGSMPFTYAFFLGYYDRGIQWFCPSDRGWSNIDDSKKISLVRDKNEVSLRITFVDKPFHLQNSLHLNFGLMVTPVKKLSPRGRDLAVIQYGRPSGLRKTGLAELAKQFARIKNSGGSVIKSYLSEDTPFFGQPWVYDDSDRTFLKQLTNEVHQAGLQYLPYSGWGVSTGIPEFHTFGMEMLQQPLRNVGWGSYWMNPESSAWADWFLGGVKDDVTNLGFDGIYLDSTIGPKLTANELDDMGWSDAQGHLHGTYPVWALRHFVERLYILLHSEIKTDGIVNPHEGGPPQYYIDSFIDYSKSGEGYLKKANTVLETFTPDEFAASFSTFPQGVPRADIWRYWMKLPITQAEMRGMQWLHDTPMPTASSPVIKSQQDIGYGRKTVPWARLRLLREHYANATFEPYWDTSKAPLIESTPEGLLSSAWVDTENKRAMVIVVNLSDKPWKGTVKFNLQRLGVSPDAPVSDAMFNVPLNAKASQPLSVSIEEQRYRLFLINDNLPIQNPVKKDETEKSLPAVIP